MKEKTKNGNPFKKAGIISAITLGIITILIIANTGITPEPKTTTMKWREVQTLRLGQEFIPAAGESSILIIYFINHSAGDYYYAQENNSATLEGYCNASGLGYANADDQELDIAHSTAFDIVIKVRGNATHCKHGATWWDSDLNVTITWSDKALTNDQPDGNTTYPQANMNTSAFGYLYTIFYWDNGGAGYTINKGQTTEVGDIIFAAYY